MSPHDKRMKGYGFLRIPSKSNESGLARSMVLVFTTFDIDESLADSSVGLAVGSAHAQQDLTRVHIIIDQFLAEHQYLKD